MSERWKSIGWAPGYEVSDKGRVRSVERVVVCGANARRYKGRVLRAARSTTSGHLSVFLGRAFGKANVHTLVACAFCGPRPSARHEVRHRNGRSHDNECTNLFWSTRSRNAQDKKWHDGQANYKLTPADVKTIKSYLRDPPRGEQRRMAALYGVAESTISAIKHGRFHCDV